MLLQGIEIGAPGYKKIIIHPQPDARLTYAKASYNSRYGIIKSHWEVKNETLQISVTIPPNTTATIILPNTTIKIMQEKENSILNGINGLTEKNGNVYVEVGSGSI